jgi:hypothetical protein
MVGLEPPLVDKKQRGVNAFYSDIGILIKQTSGRAAKMAISVLTL